MWFDLEKTGEDFEMNMVTSGAHVACKKAAYQFFSMLNKSS